jgi:3-vinyl bacteriochlorophyllide hydratase
MNASVSIGPEDNYGAGRAFLGRDGAGRINASSALVRRAGQTSRLSAVLDDWIDRVAPCPWEAHVGLNPRNVGRRDTRAEAGDGAPRAQPPLYSPEERARRDATPWTLVQGILAPLQFLVFGVSLVLVLRYLTTGEGYALATSSILLKTVLLYAIMITGSIWEKAVFGKWLFARAFFWEDVFSFLVLGLQTAYLSALLMGWGSPRGQMLIAVAAYSAYVINATQFVLKLRAARLQAASLSMTAGRAA